MWRDEDDGDDWSSSIIMDASLFSWSLILVHQIMVASVCWIDGVDGFALSLQREEKARIFDE